MVDDEDSSLTRCNSYMLDLFEKADMQVRRSKGCAGCTGTTEAALLWPAWLPCPAGQRCCAFWLVKRLRWQGTAAVMVLEDELQSCLVL